MNETIIILYIGFSGAMLLNFFMLTQLFKYDKELKILRGRDNLNSNKTLKEFCKNKKGLEE